MNTLATISKRGTRQNQTRQRAKAGMGKKAEHKHTLSTGQREKTERRQNIWQRSQWNCRSQGFITLSPQPQTPPAAGTSPTRYLTKLS